jgi:hypothetical protein
MLREWFGSLVDAMQKGSDRRSEIRGMDGRGVEATIPRFHHLLSAVGIDEP